MDGKNKRHQIEFNDTVHNQLVNCDSQEEYDFFEWLCEAYILGIILDFKYQPQSFQLFENVSYVDVNGKTRSLFREHKYSPDFQITFDHNKFKTLAKEFKLNQSLLNTFDVYDVFVDVKGTFAKSDGGRSFSINQKWVYDKYGIYIYKLVPKEFFKLFGVPQLCRLTKKTKKPRKAYLGYSSIIESFQL